MDTSTTIPAPSLVKEVSEVSSCQFCTEQATIQTMDGIKLCGIPGNHPEYDNESHVLLVPLYAE